MKRCLALGIPVLLLLGSLTAGCQLRQPSGTRDSSVRIVDQSTDCASGKAVPTELDRTGPKSYRITGTISVSNPCHTLAVTSSNSGGVLAVRLKPQRQDGACMMCMGRMQYALKVRTTAETIRILREGKVLLEQSTASIP